MKSVDNQTECAKQNKNMHQSSNYKLSKMIKNLSKLVNITPNIMKLDIYFIRTIFLHFLIYFFLHFTSFIFRISHTLYSKLATMMGKWERNWISCVCYTKHNHNLVFIHFYLSSCSYFLFSFYYIPWFIFGF